jgi:hypothetical protein
MTSRSGETWGSQFSIQGLGLAFLLLVLPTGKVFADNELITVPVIVADYYAWAYTEAFMDHADIYAWSTAGVDALGWTLILTKKDYTGLFFVNVAGVAKTIYPVAVLLGAQDPASRERAWIAVGTHTASLLTLELLGRPALNIQSSMGPHQDGTGMELAFNF